MLIEASNKIEPAVSEKANPAPKSQVKKRVFSGVQPTGSIHIGNYLGAIRNWVNAQTEFDNIFCIVDLHAITLPVDPEELHTNTRKLAALYLACGLDTRYCKLFVQSHVHQHARDELDLELFYSHGLAGPHDAVQEQGRRRHGIRCYWSLLLSSVDGL